LNLGEKNSSTFKDFQGCVGTLLVVDSLTHRQPVELTSDLTVSNRVNFPSRRQCCFLQRSDSVDGTTEAEQKDGRTSNQSILTGGRIAEGGQIFHGGKVSVTLTSSEQCSRLPQLRVMSLLIFYCPLQ